MYKFLIFLILFEGALHCPAQDAKNIFGDQEDTVYEDVEEQVEEKPDTILIKNTQLLPADSIALMKGKKEFAYVPLMDSLLKAEGVKEVRTVSQPVSMVERFFNSAFFRFFIWLIPIALVSVVLYNLLKSRGVFARKKESPVHEEGEEDVQQANHDYMQLAREAAQMGSYRPAVKYLFLRTLQQLSGAGFINYALDKTNYNYVQEIGTEKKKEFARLVLNYEYVWYGNTVPDKSTYNKIEDEFLSFFQKYNLS
jgi:hypothetical protein